VRWFRLKVDGTVRAFLVVPKAASLLAKDVRGDLTDVVNVGVPNLTVTRAMSFSTLAAHSSAASSSSVGTKRPTMPADKCEAITR